MSLKRIKQFLWCLLVTLILLEIYTLSNENLSNNKTLLFFSNNKPSEKDFHLYYDYSHDNLYTNMSNIIDFNVKKNNNRHTNKHFHNIDTYKYKCYHSKNKYNNYNIRDCNGRPIR